MHIETLVLGSLQTNCYLVFDEKTKKGIIIDPADEGQYILQKIQDFKMDPVAIIATHGHFDHILAATELRLTLNVPFLMHESDLFLLKSVEERSKYWTGLQSDPPLLPDKYLEEGDLSSLFQISNFKFQILLTPGHTPGSICIYSEKEKILFTGDTLFKDGIGRTDSSYGSKQKLEESLQKLFQLPPETKVFPGHGETTTVRFLTEQSFFHSRKYK